MEIDLTKVLAYSKDCLQSRAQMRSIMMDMYPGKTRDMNVLLAVYESGIPKKIKNDGAINGTQYVSYIKKIADDYGLTETYIIDALNTWIDVCIKPGTAERLVVSLDTYIVENGSQPPTYPQPIVHNQGDIGRKPVLGNAFDYEIKDIGNGKIEISKFVGFDKADTIIPTEINGKKEIGIYR